MKLPTSIRFLIYVAAVAGLIIAAIAKRQEPFFVIFFSASSLIILIAGAIYGYLSYISPVSLFKNKIESLSSGEIDDIGSFKSGLETGQLEKALNDHVNRLKEIVEVINELSKGKVVERFELLSENDLVGQAIIELQESIIKNNQEAFERRKYDEQENWASQGLARFGGLIREFDQDVPHFSQVFITELVKYIEAEVGCLFLQRLESEDQFEYVLAATYAFDRAKYLKKTFKPGEGLVGRCALERQSILITDVPEDYIRIRSGTGEEKPSTIILVPVINGQDVLGIIEMASFSKIADYKIKFLESLAGSIAPTVVKAIPVP